METLFLLVVILMLGLAVFDLVVGVSNDAVNFLSSAIGSRASTFRVLMIIASAGVLVGSLASGGMMEVAKRGMFNPELFSFEDIIFLYVVVMLTDIFLLDLFNSLRLPTSTTVSIVFELLGAALAISFMRMFETGQSTAEWFTYINSAKAIKVILAIFVSVGFAFTAGWLVQWLMRTLVTYDYKKYMQWGGSIFGALSVAIVSNFIITKGMKPIKDSALVASINDIGIWLYIGIGLATFLFFFFMSRSRNMDVFRAVTFIGTFALAMAFASNDLVNFIGVPVAGYEAWEFWTASGQSATEYMMTPYAGEAGKTTANPFFLVIAGVIMIITLWISKKARNVIQTTVNLSRQNDGVERFKGNDLARIMVRLISAIAGGIIAITPKFIRDTIRRRYATRAPFDPNDTNQRLAAFDYVRASVNLVVAAIVITIGTVNKLPLSTTYVTFMVIMGTSLADRAWNRDSAVYRVSGVFTVIGGWFITAVTAMSVAGFFAVIAHRYEFYGVGIVILLVILGMYLVNRYTDTEEDVASDVWLPDDWFKKPLGEVQDELKGRVREINRQFNEFVEDLVEAVIREDRKTILELDKRLKRRDDQNFYYEAAITEQLRGSETSNVATGKALLDFYVEEAELIREFRGAVDVAKLHILNMHSPLDDEQKAILTEFIEKLKRYDEVLDRKNGISSDDLEQLLHEINEHAENAITHQVKGLTEERYTFKNSQLFFTTFVGHLNATDIIHRMYLITETGTSTAIPKALRKPQ